MGARNFLVEGVSGTGKTSVCHELRRRGFHAVNGDTDLAYQGDPLTGLPTDTALHEHHLWDIGRVQELVADHSTPLTFFCGGSRNVDRLTDLFDGVFVLQVDRATLEQRLDLRTGDEWGADPDERALVLRLHETGEDVPDGIAIDATRPLDDVVDEIVRLAGHRPAVMGRHATVLGLFLTHPEVVVDPAVPVTEWGLSDQGRARARAFARSLTDQGWDLIASSGEQKAIETAEVLRSALGVPLVIDELLGENDRSATGYLPADEFERTADSFFAHPTTSIRGWETASSAQDRIVSTVRRISADAPGRRIAYVAHGAVGSLLLSDLMRVPISRELDQPRQGCWFTFDPTAWSSAQGWQPFPEA